MGEIAERTLKAKYRRRVGQDGKVEQPWINDYLRGEIKKRRKLNEEHRNWKGEEGKGEAW